MVNKRRLNLLNKEKVDGLCAIFYKGLVGVYKLIPFNRSRHNEDKTLTELPTKSPKAATVLGCPLPTTVSEASLCQHPGWQGSPVAMHTVSILPTAPLPNVVTDVYSMPKLPCQHSRCPNNLSTAQSQTPPPLLWQMPPSLPATPHTANQLTTVRFSRIPV